MAVPDSVAFLCCLLASPLHSAIKGGRERYQIVIDALNEARDAGRNPLVEMLTRNAQHLPDWLGLVITSGPEFDVIALDRAADPPPDHENLDHALYAY